MTPEVHPAHDILLTRDGAAELDGWSVTFETSAAPGVRRQRFFTTERHADLWSLWLRNRQDRGVDL